jgi:hypothetical protein
MQDGGAVTDKMFLGRDEQKARQPQGMLRNAQDVRIRKNRMEIADTRKARRKTSGPSAAN